jgi:hypothetical protein
MLRDAGERRRSTRYFTTREDIVGLRSSTSAIAVVCTAAWMTAGAALAAEDMKYPDWQGAWARWVPPHAVHDPGNGGTGLTAGGQPSFDQTKPWGLGQEAPLTPEYQKILEDSIADQESGGQGNFFDHAVRCQPGGMPLMTIAFQPLEFVVTPATTYILIGGSEHFRRLFTDGREWPAEIEASYAGYSIGRWIDEDGDGVYDVLEVETRGPFKGRRTYDASGLPLHFDNQSVFFERIHRDKVAANILHDEITVIDHALTRPWTVDKKYVRDPNPHPNWSEQYCTEQRSMVDVAGEAYFLSADGRLMPVRKDQPPPDLHYFKHVPE